MLAGELREAKKKWRKTGIPFFLKATCEKKRNTCERIFMLGFNVLKQTVIPVRKTDLPVRKAVLPVFGHLEKGQPVFGHWYFAPLIF